MSIKNLIRDVISSIISYNNFTKINVFFRGGLHYIPMLGYADIKGWFTPKEAMALYDVALDLPEGNPLVCEIGSWQGKSSVVIAKGIIKKNNPKLYCVDPFDGMSDERSMAGGTVDKPKSGLKETFIINMKQNKVNNIITILEGYSHKVVQGFDENLDLLFIDGNHDYEAVLNDYLDWMKFVKVGGFIGFHDTTWPGPEKVIREHIMNRLAWKIIKNVDDLIIAQKLGN